MEKLKCESCGANLEIDQNNEYATCKYCNLKYKLKKDVNLNISLDEQTRNDIIYNGAKPLQRKIISIVAIIITIVIAFILVRGFISFGSNSSTSSSSFDKEEFNNQFEMHSGKQPKIFVEDLFDDVTTNNKKNSDKKITVIYNEITTSNSDEITDLYDKLEDKDYKVILDYDDNGYVNKITIKD